MSGLSEGVRAALDALFSSNPYLELLGAELVDWGPGRAEVAMLPGPGHANIVGTVHGGITTGLADIAFEVACNSYGRVCVALELGVHFTLPARLGERLVARASEVARSARTASYRIDVTQGAQTVASLQALAYRTSRWHVDPALLPEGWAERY